MGSAVEGSVGSKQSPPTAHACRARQRQEGFLARIPLGLVRRADFLTGSVQASSFIQCGTARLFAAMRAKGHRAAKTQNENNV